METRTEFHERQRRLWANRANLQRRVAQLEQRIERAQIVSHMADAMGISPGEVLDRFKDAVHARFREKGV